MKAFGISWIFLKIYDGIYNDNFLWLLKKKVAQKKNIEYVPCISVEQRGFGMLEAYIRENIIH